jgi:hypothetical protein
MLSVWVRFSPGFPLRGGFPAEQFAPAWWYETAGGEERLLQQSSTAFWRCSGESCSGGIRISAEKGISRIANCLVFAPAVFEIRRAPQETSFFLAPAVFYSRRAPRGCSALLEILLLEEIQG